MSLVTERTSKMCTLLKKPARTSRDSLINWTFLITSLSHTTKREMFTILLITSLKACLRLAHAELQVRKERGVAGPYYGYVS